MSQTSRVNAMKSSARMLLANGNPARPPLLGALGSAEAALAGHDHPFGDVAQHGIGRRAEGPPGARAAGALTLLPHDLAPWQQPQIVLQDGHDIGRQASIRLAAEVGHVDRDPSARLEHPLALGEHLPEQLEVLEVGPGHTFAVQFLLVLLAGEIGR